MTISEWMRKKMLNWLGLEHLSENPADTRLTFLSNDEGVWRERIQEYDLWYEGDSDKLYEYYLGGMAGKFAKNYIANKSKRQYFWGIATQQNERVKKTHSGVPRAIVDTLVQIIDEPLYRVTNNDNLNDKLNRILEYNNFNSLLSQQARCMGLVEGWGAYKININKEFSNYPTIQYYKANDVDFVYKDNILIGIVYKDYYRDKDNKDYLLTETRYIANGNSYIKYELFRQNGDTLTKCELSELPALGELKNLEFKGYNHILGVPNIYFYDQFHEGYGRSIFTGKLDVFDDLDQCLSQASTTIRYSTPIEYVNAEFLQRGPNGQEALPQVFCRRYIMLEGEMDADGKGGTQAVTVTQPELNVQQFSSEYNELLKVACSGILTLSTLGIMQERVSNANAEREREKVTIMTRDNIIAKESISLKKLFKLLIDCYHYMDTNEMSDYNLDISIKYNEFANPSFENELRVLGNAWSMGQISTDNYIKLLWKDRLSADQMQKEFDDIVSNRNAKYGTFNAYNEQEKADAEMGETDGISDNPLNK